MLMWIPIISPIDITISPDPRQINNQITATDPSRDSSIDDAEYTIHDPDPLLPSSSTPVQTSPTPRVVGPPKDLNGPVRPVMYQDEHWWRDKIAAARRRLRGETSGGGDPSP